MCADDTAHRDPRPHISDTAAEAITVICEPLGKK
jgi:hypothetical protein